MRNVQDTVEGRFGKAVGKLWSLLPGMVDGTHLAQVVVVVRIRSAFGALVVAAVLSAFVDEVHGMTWYGPGLEKAEASGMS